MHTRAIVHHYTKCAKRSLSLMRTKPTRDIGLHLDFIMRQRIVIRCLTTRTRTLHLSSGVNLVRSLGGRKNSDFPEKYPMFQANILTTFFPLNVHIFTFSTYILS